MTKTNALLATAVFGFTFTLASLSGSGGALAASQDEVQAPRGQDSERPRGLELQTPRGQDTERPRSLDVQTPRGQETERPRGEVDERRAETR